MSKWQNVSCTDRNDSKTHPISSELAIEIAETVQAAMTKDRNNPATPE